MDNKFNLEAFLLPGNLSTKQKKEIASKLSLPDNNQHDLLFMSAILVSTGTNKNLATFLGSELIKAKNTINLKALDLEHQEDKIIGHIYSSMFFDQSGELIDVDSVYEKLSNLENNKEESEDLNKLVASLDSTEMDIGIIAIIYKDRFPEIAEEVSEGKWKVSMECYYSDFDVKVGDKIIKKGNLNTNLIGNDNKSLLHHLNLVIGGNSLGTHMVSRVLRNIKFCGCGIVKNPANDRSIILEAAHHTEQILDQTNNINDEAASTINLKEKDIIINSNLYEDLDKDSVIQTGAYGYLIAKNTNSGFEIIEDSFTTDYNYAQKTAIRLVEDSKKLNEDKTVYTILTLNSSFNKTPLDINFNTTEGMLYKTNKVGDIKEIISIGASKEAAKLASRFGPDNRTSGLCINFKKYVFEHDRGQQGKLIATHWCSLFNKPCPVLGADAQDKACLRNRYARLTKLGNMNDSYTVPMSYNPQTPLSDDQIEVISSSDLPQPDTFTSIISQQLNYDNTNIEEWRGNDNLSGNSLNSDTFNSEINDISLPSDELNAPNNPFNQKQPISIQNPYSEFPIHVRRLSASERSNLNNNQFGLSEQRKYPIHTKEYVEHTMGIYNSICKKLNKLKDKRELFINLVLAADRFGINTYDFEKGSLFRLKANEDYDLEYAVPRLYLLPLGSREQVLAAISRYSFLKLEDLSLEEQARIPINILRAAKKFNINTENFRKKLSKYN